MTSINRLFSRLLLNPTSLRYTQIERLLLHFGCQKIQGKGSHVKFRHPAIKEILTFSVHNNDCLNVYKREAVKFINSLLT